MPENITILAPESDLPAEGADPAVVDTDSSPTASDLLGVYGNMLDSVSINFFISADGAVQLDETPSEVELMALDMGGEAGEEPSFTLAESNRTKIDLAAAAASVSDSFDAEDGLRQLVANLASGLNGDADGSAVPLVRWQRSGGEEDEDTGGVAQFLGVWLAVPEQLEALRSGGAQGIIFDEAEVEGRGLRETVAALAVLGVMVGGAASAEAGLFRRASHSKPASVQKVSNHRQAPPQVDRRALSETSASETIVIVDVSKQRAYVLADGRVILDTPVSTARSGKYTPRGEFKITQRVRTGKKSTIYGCDLPYWMRLDQSAIGMHIGDLPGYPASAGCIRLPAEVAPLIFDNTKSGTTVKVVDSWQPAGMMVASR